LVWFGVDPVIDSQEITGGLPTALFPVEQAKSA
jgi:hypothetical protein